MLNIDFDTNCAYKPYELGIQIAKLISDGNIPSAAKFAMFQDKVVMNEDKSIDNTKHLCLLWLIDDKDNSCNDLPSINNIAADLVRQQYPECSQDQGLAMLASSSLSSYCSSAPDSIDPRMKVIRLDPDKFKEMMHESHQALSEVDRFSYSEADGYFCIMRINANGLKQFAANWLDYKQICMQENQAAIVRFVKHHWPESWQSFSLSADIIDMNEVVHDDRDDVDRHVWKFMFRLYRQDGAEVKGQFAKSVS